MEKKPFVTLEQLQEIEKTYPTPFHIYDEKGFMENARKVNEAFAWNEGFREYFAVKATPNPFIIKKLKEAGCGVDCSSETELMIAEILGFRGDEIMVEGRRGSPRYEVQGSFARWASQREDSPSQRKRAPHLLQASWAAGKSLRLAVSVHLGQGHPRLFDGWDGQRFGACLCFVRGLYSEPEETEMRGREGSS